VIKNY